jgi:hypothetical protein
MDYSIKIAEIFRYSMNVILPLLFERVEEPEQILDTEERINEYGSMQNRLIRIGYISCKVNIRSRFPEADGNIKTYTIFYYKYRIVYDSNGLHDFTTIYNIPINIFSTNGNDAYVNELGLYNKFINTNAYLCKMMEYTFQFVIINQPEINKRFMFYGDRYVYNFIGDLHTNFWPLNEIYNTPEQILAEKDRVKTLLAGNP